MVDVTVNDLLRSETAKRMGIDNSMPADREVECLNSLKIVAGILNDVQRYFNSPVVVTSGYRCEALNKAVGGVPNSQHMIGEAADFYVDGVPLHRVFYFLVSCIEFDQCILYRKKNIIHISVRPSGCMRGVSYVR